MFRNTYDGDNTTFSPQGRLHQVEYAQEAVKQGSAAVGLRSKTHAILLTLKRTTGELATYQKKLIKIDDHVGVAIAGLTSDARVLSNHMRQQAMQERMLYGRPIPVARIVQSIADRAQTNTQQYGKRPYGVGFLVIGQDETGPHLFEFSPAGLSYEYHAHSIGARSQSAKTYLEDHADEFAECSLEDLIQHGLNALKDTLQQDKTLTMANTSIAIIGPPSSTDTAATGSAAATTTTTSTVGTSISTSSGKVSRKNFFRILDDEAVEPFLMEMQRRAPQAAAAAAATTTEGGGEAAAAATSEGATGSDAAQAAGGEAAGASSSSSSSSAPPQGGDGDVQMQED